MGGRGLDGSPLASLLRSGQRQAFRPGQDRSGRVRSPSVITCGGVEVRAVDAQPERERTRPAVRVGGAAHARRGAPAPRPFLAGGEHRRARGREWPSACDREARRATGSGFAIRTAARSSAPSAGSGPTRPGFGHAFTTIEDGSRSAGRSSTSSWPRRRRRAVPRPARRARLRRVRGRLPDHELEHAARPRGEVPPGGGVDVRRPAADAGLASSWSRSSPARSRLGRGGALHRRAHPRGDRGRPARAVRRRPGPTIRASWLGTVKERLRRISRLPGRRRGRPRRDRGVGLPRRAHLRIGRQRGGRVRPRGPRLDVPARRQRCARRRRIRAGAQGRARGRTLGLSPRIPWRALHRLYGFRRAVTRRGCARQAPAARSVRPAGSSRR